MEQLRGVEHQTNTQIRLTNAKCIKRSMSTILFKNRYGNVKPFYKHCNILPLTKNIKLLQGKFMWKLLAKKHPDPIIEQFPFQFNKVINNTNKGNK